jgi:hypothetical protein
MQQRNFERIEERQTDQTKEMNEKQKEKIEVKRNEEFEKKKEIDRELLRVDHEVLLKKTEVHFEVLSGFLVTK